MIQKSDDRVSDAVSLAFGAGSRAPLRHVAAGHAERARKVDVSCLTRRTSRGMREHVSKADALPVVVQEMLQAAIRHVHPLAEGGLREIW